MFACKTCKEALLVVFPMLGEGRGLEVLYTISLGVLEISGSVQKRAVKWLVESSFVILSPI